MSIKRDIIWRVALIYMIIVGASFVIIVKIIYLQFIDKEKWINKSKEISFRNIEVEPNRGDIYTSDLHLLASSIPFYEIRLDTRAPSLENKVFNEGIDSLALNLSNLFKDQSKEEYKKRLIQARKEGKRFYLVKRNVNHIQLKSMEKFPIFREGRYRGGFIVIKENKRIRPNGNLARRTIGYTSKGEYGNIVGIEGAYDHYLAGEQGKRLEQKIAGGEWIPVRDENTVEPIEGKSIVTTIDIRLQDITENALRNQLKKHNAHHGTAVLMEVSTGEVKAIVNLTDTLGNYAELYNYAIGESTEPGSTFKLPALMAALEDGWVDMDDTIDTKKGIAKYYDIVIRDENYMDGGYGKITVKQVFEYSSNVGIAKIIYEAYKDRPHHFIDRLYGMKINEKLNLEIRGEGEPVIYYPDNPYWSGVSLVSMSRGYEVKMTPLQILAFYNAIANDGKMVRPKFVREVREHGKVIKTFETEIINPSVCSKATLKKVKIMLEGVVENGTARSLKNEHFKIAGKTGTAQIYNKYYGYSDKCHQASFVGYFPADNPEYSCIVVVNSPKEGMYYGHQVAGPVFKEIAEKVYTSEITMHSLYVNKSSNNIDLPYSKSGYRKELETILRSLNINIEDKSSGYDWVNTLKQDDHIVFSEKKALNNIVPNVISMGLKDALYILENKGLEVEVKGRGSVKQQSIPAGTRVNKGEKIILEMSFI